MKLTAYVLAADPTWIRTSVLAYYPFVRSIVVSYDRHGRGWSGVPVPTSACLHALRAIDVDRKLRFVPGDFDRTHDDLMAAETAQRQAALDAAAENADWVLQLDTDEVLPDARALLGALRRADVAEQAVEWPMRVLYRRLPGGRYLQVGSPGGGVHVEYPGHVAVRAGAQLRRARRVGAPVLRVTVRDGVRALATAGAGGAGSVSGDEVTVDADQAIWHNSWARSPLAVRRKVRSWGHAGRDMDRYFWRTWLPAPMRWRELAALHPLTPSSWHHLELAPPLPFQVHPADRPR